MKSYRVVWVAVWGALLVPLGLVGLVLGEPAVVLMMSGLAAALVATLAERTHHRRWWVEVAVAVAAFSTTVYAVGPLAALSVVLLVGATSPPFVTFAASAVRREWRGRAGKADADRAALVDEVRAGAPLGPESFACMVRLLDDRELVAAWRQSHEVLGYTNLPDLRLQLIALRQAYLDEMERRHPSGFAAWMDDGAQLDPERFLVRGRTHEREQ